MDCTITIDGQQFDVAIAPIGPQGPAGEDGVSSAVAPLVLNPTTKALSIQSGHFALVGDLANYLSIANAQTTYATLLSPSFTGIPQAPQAAAGNSSFQIATTGFVANGFATKENPTFTGTVTVPTPTQGDNSQKAASTAFVTTALSEGLTPYLTSAVAETVYQKQSSMVGYLTILSASSTYYPLTNPTGYITSSALTPYLLSTTAASTYQPIGSYATTTQLSDGLAGKANTTHTHDASAIVTGTIDIARIPIIPSQVQVVSTQNSIANLTAGEQAQITGAGVLVTTTDGNRWAYSGTGSKTSEASYVKVADITPDWSEIANKPFFGTASGSDITDFAPAGWNPFNQTLNTTDEVAFRKTTLTDGNAGTIVIDPYWLGSGISSAIGENVAAMSGLNGLSVTDGTNTISIKAGAGITFADATVQTTAYTGATNPFDQSLNTTDNVNFNTVNASGGIGSLVAANDYTSLVGQQIQSYGSSGTLTISADAGITFADATVQTTAAVTPDLSGYATTADLTNGLATKLDEPTIAGLDGQILSTDGINNIWVDNFARTLKTIVRNETGETLLKGTIVYISGASGNKPLVQKAIASTEAGSNRTFGVLSQDIATNNNGEAVAVGQLVNVDTFGLTEGVSLWLSPTTAGTWTTTKPTAPDHAVFIGNVVRAHQTQGVIEVRIQNGYELDELHDVAVLDRAGGDILWYDGVTSLWKSNTISEVLGYTPADDADLANYLTTSDAALTYYPLSNPNGFITSSDLSGYAQLSQNNQFTSTNTFSGFTGFSGTVQATMAVGLTGVPLTINNYGTGNSFVVNDQISDPTPFVINSAGLVGLNVSNPAAMLDIAHSLSSGTGIRLAVASGQGFTSQAGLLFINIQNTGATGKAFVIENRGTGDCLYIHDQAATDTTPFVVNNAGDCIIGGQTITAGYKLDVRGNIISDNLKTGTIEFSDGTTLSTVPAFPNQSLNTTDQVEFAGVTLPSTGSFTINDGTHNITFSSSGLSFGSVGVHLAKDLLNIGTIAFGDGTSQTTAAVSYDQSLNTADTVTFNEVIASDGATSTTISATGVTFADGTTQTTAASGGGLDPPSDTSAPWMLSWNTDNAAWEYSYDRNSRLMRLANNLEINTVNREATHSEIVLQVGDSSTSLWTEITPAGIRFSDGSLQTTAAAGSLPIPFNQAKNWIATWHAESWQSTETVYRGDLVSNGNHAIDFTAFGPTTYLPEIRVTTDDFFTSTDITPSGIKFPDGSLQTTAASSSGLPIPADTSTPWMLSWDTTNSVWSEAGNRNSTLFAGTYSIQTGEFNFGAYTAVRVGHPAEDVWTELQESGIKFSDGSFQSTAAGGVISEGTTSVSNATGDISTSDYPTEIIVVINGTSYAMPARTIS